MTRNQIAAIAYDALRFVTTRPDWPKKGTPNIEAARDVARARAVADAIQEAAFPSESRPAGEVRA